MNIIVNAISLQLPQKTEAWNKYTVKQRPFEGADSASAGREILPLLFILKSYCHAHVPASGPRPDSIHIHKMFSIPKLRLLLRTN